MEQSFSASRHSGCEWRSYFCIVDVKFALGISRRFYSVGELGCGDRSMRFLDEKLLWFGQFRAPDSIDPMLNAWAIVNNLRSFLPDAKKAGQSLAEFFEQISSRFKFLDTKFRSILLPVR
jgi:hypothetical protein